MNLFKTVTSCGYDEVKKNVPALIKREMNWNELEMVERLANTGHELVTVGREYFYKGGVTAEKFGLRVLEEVAKETSDLLIVAWGDHWAPFCGGAKAMSAKSSFFWVVLARPKNKGNQPIPQTA